VTRWLSPWHSLDGTPNFPVTQPLCVGLRLACAFPPGLAAIAVLVGHFSGSMAYLFLRTTPTPIPLRKRSGYFSRAFSACSLVLNGLDNSVKSRPTYSKSNHCSMILDISNL
jgi:hypothetical protein